MLSALVVVKTKPSIWLLLPAGISLALFVWLLRCIQRRVGVFTRLMVAFMSAGVDVAARCGWRETDSL